MGLIKSERPVRHTSDDIKLAVMSVALRGGRAGDRHVSLAWQWYLKLQDWMIRWVEREEKRAQRWNHCTGQLVDVGGTHEGDWWKGTASGVGGDLGECGVLEDRVLGKGF